MNVHAQKLSGPSGIHEYCNLKRYNFLKSNDFLKDIGPVVTTKHGHISCILILDSQPNSQNQSS